MCQAQVLLCLGRGTLHNPPCTHHLGCDMPGDVTNKLFKSGVRGAPVYQEGAERGTQGAGCVGQTQTRNGGSPLNPADLKSSS